jgi:hypothetical protein
VRPAAKRDGNEGEIIAALEAIGYTVDTVSSSGHPDLLCGSPIERRLFLIEVKEKGEPLTPKQKKFHAKWHAFPVYVAFNVPQALLIARQFN